jgi:hypothetical protein
LLGIKITIHALWHAGSYDPQDFLGRLIGDAPWVRHSEKAFFAAIDHNYFATDFHIDMFVQNLLDAKGIDKFNWLNHRKIVRTGWPMEYMEPTLEVFKELPKRDLILFPHRLAPEKQVEIFRDLKTALPQYEWIVCQDTQLSKVQYHVLLASAKIVFSANLQETLGISMYEGALVNAIPLVPDRLSYSEMFSKIWKYPSAWTESWGNYQQHKQQLIAKIVDLMDNYNDYADYVPQQAAGLTNNFFSATKLLENIQ